MSNLPFIGLLNNAALLLALGVIYGTLQKRSDELGWKIARGCLLGIITIGVMVNPWQLAPGMIFDTRTILLSVGGIFLGLIPTTIAIVMAGLYRLEVGGVGAFTGTCWIVASGLLGVAWARVRKRPTYRFSALEFYLFGLFVHLILLLLMFTMPNALAIPILGKITLPILLIFPLATVLLAKLLAGQELQMHNEKELDRSERKYRELVQNSRAILLRIDGGGNITFINEYAQNFFGYPKDELLGKKIVGTIVPKTDRAGQNLEALIKQLLEHPDSFPEHENENICKGGRRVRVLWKNTPLRDASGRMSAIQCFGHDVTELRKAETILKTKEEQLRRLVDVSPVPLAIVELDQSAFYINRKFSDLFGYTLDEIPSLEAWWPLAYPEEEYRARIKQRWNSAVARTSEEEAIFNPQESRVTCKDGSVRDVVILFSSIGERGIVVLNDVSRERELDRMKSEFIATAAHELRTPLASVKGFTELLLDENEFDEAQRKEFLSIVYEKSEVLEAIIDDLLDLGRVESGRLIHLEKRPCDLDELVLSSVGSYRKEFRNRRFDFAWPEQRTGEIQADPLKIGQVMENLLNNAIKFSAPDNPIRIGGSITGGEMRVTVQDEGVGMAPDQVSHVFDKFYRADNSDTAPPGLGLGMAIAKGIVEAHGGSIWVESEQGRGTVVTFALPLA